MKIIMKSVLLVLIGAIAATSLVTAEPVSKAGLIQHTLRGTPISTDPRVTPADGPPVEPHFARDAMPAREPVFWPQESHISVIARTFFACSWVMVIASLPFIIPLIDKQPVTKTQKIVGASMFTVLFGGLYLFTNVILFESVHFKQTRPLTIIECIYFMSQVITTVGYGDIVPAKVRGQIFVGLYVLGALFIIAMLVSDVTNHVTSAAHKYRQQLTGVPMTTPRRELSPSARQAERMQHSKSVPMGHSKSVHDLIVPKKPSTQALCLSLACFVVIDICWVIFFSCWPGEEKTVFQAIYMSVITLSTVGLGAFTPLTEAGMIFGAFFMLFGSGALVSSVSNFCTLVVKMNEYERFSHGSKKQATQHLEDIVQGSKQVTKLQFFEWAVINQKLMTATQVKGVFEAFETLDPSGGMVDLKKVEESMDVPLSAR